MKRTLHERCGRNPIPSGAEARTSFLTTYAALEAPLFHGSAICLRVSAACISVYVRTRPCLRHLSLCSTFPPLGAPAIGSRRLLRLELDGLFQRSVTEFSHTLYKPCPAERCSSEP